MNARVLLIISQMEKQLVNEEMMHSKTTAAHNS